MKNKTRLALIGIIFVNVMWGLSVIASKYAMQHGLKPFSLALVRYIVTPLVLFPVLIRTEGGLRFPKKDWLLMAVSGLFGATIYFFFENNGVLRTTAANASLILAAIPVFTMLSGVVFHHRRHPALSWLGVVLSLLGVYLVVASDSEGMGTLGGNLLMLGACICWVVYIETTDVLLKRHSSLSITCWQSLFSLVSLIPFGLSEGVNWLEVTPGAYLAAGGFLGLICSAVCFILYAYSIKYLSPGRSSIFINLNPLTAILGGTLILHEPLSPVSLIGGAIIILSIFLVNRPET